MAWTEPKFSGTRRTKAGKALAAGVETAEDLEVIDNWRSAHSQPLQTIKMLLKGRAKAVDKDAIVAQRLKRLPSIRAKLKRESLRLQQMQDLGGCRAIVKDMPALLALAGKFQESVEKDPKKDEYRRHQIEWQKNYVIDPKPDGYRGIHYVFSYQTGTQHLKCFEGLLIEVQIRTKLQHAWATAVEIVDTFTGQELKSALKTQIGDRSWRRFFALMGTAIAMRERAPLVPGTPTTATALRRELREYARRTDVRRVLSGLQAAVQRIGTGTGSGTGAFVLELNADARSIRVTSFAASELEAAQQYLFDKERESKDQPSIQVVYVSVEKMDALKVAYPNYYLDTTLFLRALDIALK
jgi:ppGpp synthetase/RelA/SpoT-type nucleotidyltranferase